MEANLIMQKHAVREHKQKTINKTTQGRSPQNPYKSAINHAATTYGYQVSPFPKQHIITNNQALQKSQKL